jgi:hypothetical protein
MKILYMNTNIISALVEIATYLSFRRLGSKVVWVTTLLQSDIQLVVVVSICCWYVEKENLCNNLLVCGTLFIYFGVITFSPHELPAYVILPPRTTTSTKKKNQITIFTYFAPFR